MSSPLLPSTRRGITYDGLLHQTDAYVTLATLAGVSAAAFAASEPVAHDGMAIWPTLLTGEPSPRKDVVHNIFGTNPGSITVGRYKLLKGDPGGGHPYNGYNCWNATPCQAKNAKPLCTWRPCLYDMVTDRQERHDLSAKEPALLKQLEERYAELAESEVSLEAAGLCPSDAPLVDGCTANRGTGVWSPWLEADESERMQT